MKIAQNKPLMVKSVVKSVDGSYEAWYSKPVSLGPVYNRSGYWYTQDGMRFISNRDALEYLIKRYDAGAPVPTEGPEPRSIEVRTEPEAPKAKEVVAKAVTKKTIAAAVSSKKAAPQRAGAAFNPNAVPPVPKVQDPFLREILEYLKQSPEIKKILRDSTLE